jgi:predicted transcriptional regulator
MTEFQERVVETIRRHNVNGSLSQARIRHLMRVHNTAAYNSLSALERQGIVGHFLFGSDMWAERYWFLTRKAEGVTS